MLFRGLAEAAGVAVARFAGEVRGRQGGAAGARARGAHVARGGAARAPRAAPGAAAAAPREGEGCEMMRVASSEDGERRGAVIERGKFSKGNGRKALELS